jgi:hypothetical protein
MPSKAKGRFIDPMLLLRTDSLPNDGGRWEYQLKFDGYRAIAFKTGGKIHLRSRNDNDFSVRYANVVKGLTKLPDETAIDGEVIALDEDGRPSFNILQNYGSSKASIVGVVGEGRAVQAVLLTVREAVLAAAAGVNHAADTTNVVHFELGDRAAYSSHAPDDLVSGHDGVLRWPPVAVDDVDVGMTDARIQHIEEHVVWAESPPFNL